MRPSARTEPEPRTNRRCVFVWPATPPSPAPGTVSGGSCCAGGCGGNGEPPVEPPPPDPPEEPPVEPPPEPPPPPVGVVQPATFASDPKPLSGARSAGAV